MNSDELRRGIALFNQGQFFEAHEILEDVWRTAPADQKKCFQGLVQVAVAFHHYSTGNRIGMRSVLERALRNLDGCTTQFHGVNVAALTKSVARWLIAFDAGEPVLPLPRMEIAMETDDAARKQ